MHPAHSPARAALALALACSAATAATPTPPLPASLQARAAGILSTYLRLSRQAVPEESNSVPDFERADPGLLPLTVAQTIVDLKQLLCCHPSGPWPTVIQATLQSAISSLQQADAMLSASHTGPTADPLPVLLVIADQQDFLDQSLDLAASTGTTALIGLLLPAVQKVREAAARTSRSLIDLALAAGVSTERLAPAEAAMRQGDTLHAAGDHGPAVVQYGQAASFAAATVTFSMNRFEQNLKSVFDVETVGWAYALSQGGVLARSGAAGAARTAADAPAKSQSPTRKMHLASVSKTMTAILMQRLLADLGISVDASIGPWLPSHWTRGAGADAITFRELMTHRSGIGQMVPPGSSGQYSSYEALRGLVAGGVAAKTFDYDNANFAMMRVLSARLQGIDLGLPGYAQADQGALAATMFLIWAQTLFGSVGVPFSCEPLANAPTRDYNFPADGNPGYVYGPMSLSCGGFGVFLSATDLARVLANLRYTGNLLGPATYTQMKTGYLGFMNPADNYNFAQGAFGKYHTHGGDWDHSSGGMNTCVMVFPINVEAAVVINSSGKNAGQANFSRGYQCSVLKWAFENAWVAS